MTEVKIAPQEQPFVTGQIVHNEEEANPIHHVEVQVFAKGFFEDSLLGRAQTDDLGKFKISFPAPSYLLSKTMNLVVKVVDYPWEWKDYVISSNRQRVIAKMEFPNQVLAPKLDIGKRSIEFWEYQKDWPRLRMPKSSTDQPQHPTKAYQLERLANGFDDLFKANVIVPLVKGKETPEDVQKLWSKNLTVKQEELHPGSTRTGEWMGDRLLNGFNPTNLRKGSKEGEYQVVYNWDSYVLETDRDLPNATAKLEMINGRPVVQEVTIQYRKKPAGLTELPPVSSNGQLEAAVTYKKGDRGFADALKEFRTAYLVSGELDMHLGGGHLNTEQYAVAAFRNFRNSPLQALLFPHLREVVLINYEGNGIIFGNEGILATATALTPDSVDKKLKDFNASLDWKGFKPRKPLSDHHRFAHIATIYWDLLTKHVDRFFEQNDAAIRANWFEVLQFSKDLVSHSLPYKPLEGVAQEAWADTSEISDPAIPRAVVNGVVRAISPITTSAMPDAEAIANLKQACAYAIFRGTFWHSWVNDHQKEDGGDVNHGVLGLRRNSQVSVEDAAKQLFLANVLIDSTYGMILDNENHDVPREFQNDLRSAKNDFAKYNFNPKDVRAVINI